MTSGQLARRAKIIEEVIDLIGEVGADAVQMRDVAQRSGVALATLYRYFSSKENLLAAALVDWQKRLTRRILAGAGPVPGTDPLPGILDYLRRAQRAFNRNPEMTALMLQMMRSNDPDVQTAIDEMNRTNVELFNRLLSGVDPDLIPKVSFGLNAALSAALAGFRTRRLTLDESLDHVEWVARVLLAGAQPD